MFTKKVLEPIGRLNSGWNPIGAVKRPKDTRTKEQLVQTIEAYASKLPEIKEFAEKIKKLPQKHMGIIADTLELSTTYEFTMTPINLRDINGKNYCPILINDMIEASEKNPEALELVDAVINNSDITASKYVLASMSGGILKNKNLATHMKETAKIIPELAEQTLSGGYTGTFEKENNFLRHIQAFVNPETKIDKIVPLFQEIAKFCDERKEHFHLNAVDFIRSNVPLKTIMENLDTAKQVLDTANGKIRDFNLIDFILKNTNIK